MDRERWHPPDPKRMARMGLVTSLLLAPVVLLDAVSRGGLSATSWSALVVGVLSSTLAVLVVRSVWRDGAAATVLFYLWTVIALVALPVFVVGVGGDARRYGILYGLVIATIAGSFPSAGQWLLQPLILLSYAATLVASGSPTPDVAVQLAIAGVFAYVAIEVAWRLRASGRAEAVAREDAERHQELAGALARLTSLDPDELMDRIVDAVIDLGFELAHIGVLRDGYMVPERHRGFEAIEPPYPIPADRGLVGEAFTQRRTVAVADYLEFADRLPDREGVRAAVAVPLVIDDELIGALIAARSTPGDPSAAEIEALEVLATHAAHALVNARRFVAERDAVLRLTELDERRSDFVSNVSHELRTPLTVIHGLGQTLAVRGDALDARQRQVLLARLMANTERLGVMVSSLLALARLESGSAPVSPAPVRLSDAVPAVLRRLEPLAGEHHLSADVADVAVLVDPTLFEHVIENLVVNAFRHTPAGTAVRVVATTTGDLARVAVCDDGPGVPPDELARLTQRFYRGGDGGDAGGTGLGLALCEQILAAHDTTLEVASVVGEGAEFSFRLPVALSASASATSARSRR